MHTSENDFQKKHTPARELEQLDIFAGKWNIEELPLNRSRDDDPVRGIATYDWLAGKFFMITKWSNKFVDSSHIGIGVIGFDESTGNFTVNQYDNLGVVRFYALTVKRLTWKFNSDHERATVEFTPDGRTFTEIRETSEDGVIWKPSCRLKGNKLP